MDSDGDIKTHQSRATVTLKLKMLKEDVSEALAFATELWLHANVTDVKRIHVALGDLKGDYRDSVTYGASSFASQYAVAPFTQAAWESEEVGGVTQWAFLANLQRMDEVAVMMERLQKKLSNRTRMSFHLTGMLRKRCWILFHVFYRRFRMKPFPQTAGNTRCSYREKNAERLFRFPATSVIARSPSGAIPSRVRYRSRR